MSRSRRAITRANYTLAKNRIPYHPSGTLAVQENLNGRESVPPVHDIQQQISVPPVHDITSLTTPCPDTEPVTACDAPLVPAVSAVPDVSGIEISPNTWIDDWDGLLPDKEMVDAYIATWLEMGSDLSVPALA